MRILLKINYTNILFGKGAQVSGIIQAFDEAQLVDVKGGWGEPEQFIPTKDVAIELRLVQEDCIALPDNREKNKELFEMFAKKSEELKETKDRLAKFTKVAEGISDAKV